MQVSRKASCGTVKSSSSLAMSYHTIPSSTKHKPKNRVTESKSPLFTDKPRVKCMHIWRLGLCRQTATVVHLIEHTFRPRPPKRHTNTPSNEWCSST